MKKTVLIITFLVVALGIKAQQGFSYCATAVNLCDYLNVPVDPITNTRNISFPFSSSNSLCIGNKTRIFLKFECWHGNPTNTGGGTNLNYTAVNQLNSSTQTKLKIHGPFNSDQNYCDLVNNFQSPIAYDSSHVSPNLQPINLQLHSGKIYYFEFLVNSCEGTLNFNIDFRLLTCPEEPPCQDCLPTFMPSPGKYVLSAWVKEISPNAGTTTFNDPSLSINPHIEISDSIGVVGQLYASGEIIDGWQKIEGQFTIVNPNLFRVELISGLKETLFDDIRVYPNEGSAITYVYDPFTYRLMAELDERNYATLYEYDEEGKLIRIKKETEKGVMTIQENRENNSLGNGQ